MRHRSRRRLGALLLAGALASSACSATSGPEPTPSAPPAVAEPRAGDDAGPFAWRRVGARDAGFDRRVLERLADDAERSRSTCLLVAHRGRLVGEWYWQGTDESSAQEVYSVTKSVTSTLVGLAQADGLLDVDDRAARWVRPWRGAASDAVTVRNLLANDSGREWSPESDYSGLIFAPDRTSYAVGLGQQFDPGAAWAYNNAAIQTLDAVLRGATGETTDTYAQRRLLGPLGMADTRMTGDAAGASTSTAFGLSSTCRDLARFGTLLSQRGRWQGEQLLPASWVEESVGAPATDLNAAYGLLWWLNREGPLRGPLDQTDLAGSPAVVRTGQIAPGAPDDLYAALGLGGQVVLVDPTSRTVVVRLGSVDLTDLAGGDEASEGSAAAPTYTFADAARVVTEAR